jgi:hypothetical protein
MSDQDILAHVTLKKTTLNLFPTIFTWKRQGEGIFPFSTAFRQAVGPTRSHIQWIPGALFPGVKRLGREAASSVKVRRVREAVLPLPSTYPQRVP